MQTADDGIRMGPSERDVPIEQHDWRFSFCLGLIGFGALAVRVYWVLVGYDNYKVAGDALYFHWQSWAVADGYGFVNPFAFQTDGIVTPMAAHPPLYTLYLAFFSKLGFVTVTEHRLVSCLLGTAAVVLIGCAGRSIAGRRVGLIAAAIAAVYPNLWINDGMLMSESLTAMVMPLVLLAAYRFWRRPQLSSAVLLGAALGLAALTRGEAALLAVLIVVPLLWGMRALTINQRTLLLVVTALVTIIFVTPWIAYNLSRFEKPVYLTDHTGAVLRAASCDNAYYGTFAGWYFCPAPPVPNGDASVKDAVLLADAKRYIRAHLDRLPIVAAMRVGRLWDVYKVDQTMGLNANVEGRTEKASRLAVVGFWLLAPFAIGGLIVLRRQRIPISPIVAPIIAVTLAAAATYGVLRYRASAEPGIVIAAAVGINTLWSSMARRRGVGSSP